MSNAAQTEESPSSRPSGVPAVQPGGFFVSEQDGGSNAAGRRLPYQPALDGMRGLAVAAVLAYHAGLPWARGGFLGVDAFFVLSGYLITSLLLSEWRATGSISLLAFWSRRARRLLPALFLVLVGVGFYAIIFAQPEELARLRDDALATLGYVANWRPVLVGESYFDQFSLPSPLRHTWSLAIEEQWYAVWPVLVIVLLRLRRGSLATLLGVSLVLAAGSALLMAWLHDPQGDPSRVYYGTDTRAQSLLVGAVLAVVLLQHGRALADRAGLLLQLAGLVSVAYIGWMWVTTSDNSVFLYRGGLLLLALAVAVVIAAAVRPARGPLASILSIAPLRGLGLISYGVYLWHWPIYLVLTPERVGWDGYSLFALRVLITLAIAVASYLLLETPFRRGSLRQWRASWALAPAAAAVLVIGLVLVTRGGEPALNLSTSDAPPPPNASEVLSDSEGAATSPPVRVLLLGDSVALTMGLGLIRAESTWNLSVWNKGVLGCGVLRGGDVFVSGTWRTQRAFCNDWAARWQSYVDVFEPDVVVVLAGAWDLYDRKIDGRVLEFGTPGLDTFVLSELEDAVDVLSSGGAAVMLLTTPYFEVRNLSLDYSVPRFDSTRVDRLNSLYQRLAQQFDGVVSVVDLNGFVSPDGTDGISMEMMADGVHFTPDGADQVARWLAPKLDRAGRRDRDVVVEPASPDRESVAAMPAARWLELLRQVPDTKDARLFTVVNDYARFRAAFNISLPGGEPSDDALFEYYQRLTLNNDGRTTGLAPADVTGIAGFPPPLGETRQQLGFTIVDVDQDVWIVERGDGPLIQVLRGRFDEAGNGDANRADSTLAVRPEEVFTSAIARSGGSSGVGRVHIIRDDYLYTSEKVGGLLAMIYSSAGEGRSLADVASFQLLASGLDRLGTYTALFSEDAGSYAVPQMARRLAGGDASEESVQAIQERLRQETKLLPYEAFATGAGVDEQGAYTAIILLNADDEVARENLRRLQDRVNEGTSRYGGVPYREFIDDVDIAREGRLVLAKLRTDRYGLWFWLHSVRETLLLHE